MPSLETLNYKERKKKRQIDLGFDSGPKDKQQKAMVRIQVYQFPLRLFSSGTHHTNPTR